MVKSDILEKRLSRFQKLLEENGIDGAMIRTLSSFEYFAGVKWLRPALFVPVRGRPVAFIHSCEREEFLEKSWIEEVRTYRRVEELVRHVITTMKEFDCRVVGLDYSIERDSYALFYELFKKFNPKIEVKDIHSLIMELRIVKEGWEIERIRRAGEIAESAMKAILDNIDEGVSELELAAEAVYVMMKKGSENPHIYVNAGPKPRIHAEPRRDVRIARGDTIMVTIGADFENYYANLSRTIFFGTPSTGQQRVFEVVKAMYDRAIREVKPGVKLMSIERKLRDFAVEKGFGEYYVTGFIHGVGLLVEEDPITTIVVAHRGYTIREGMILAFIHAPLPVPGIGCFKLEDTFQIFEEKIAPITQFQVELVL